MTLPHSTNIFQYPARFQFQTGAPCGGSSCCTDTCIQMIVEFYREKTYSLSYIRQVAQSKTTFNEAPCTGINYVEALNALNALGVTHYRVGWNMGATDVYNKVTSFGPTIVGVYYGSYPNFTTGHCGNYNKALKNGRYDCNFTGAHAVLAIQRRRWVDSTGKVHKDMYMRDPDHQSPIRPNYDLITLAQLQKAMSDLPARTAFNNTYCIYPTKAKVL